VGTILRMVAGSRTARFARSSRQPT
jgi:hypothetical protein